MCPLERATPVPGAPFDVLGHKMINDTKAEQLQCSIGNSKSQLHKAKMKMRALLFPQRNQANRADPRATVTPPARSKAA
jgi:hypothetical protein